MNQLKPHALWVGHADDGRDFRSVFDFGIRAIVQVALEESPIPSPRELIYLRFPLLDGAGNNRAVLRQAVSAVTQLFQANIPMLVCCGAGMSRAPLIAAAAMTLSGTLHWDEALALVARHRPLDLSPPLVGDVRSILEELAKSQEGRIPSKK